MKRRFWGRLLAAATSLLLLLSLSAAASADGYRYACTRVHEYGFLVDDHMTAVVVLADETGAEHLAYCVDMDHYIQDGSRYRRGNLGSADYYTAESAAKIRAIVRNAYPYRTLAEVQSLTGIASLTAAEAVTGTQMAIWHFANLTPLTYDNANVMALYGFLTALPPVEAADVPIASLTVAAASSVVGDTVTGLFRYKVDGTNADGSPIPLVPAFSREIVGDYGALVTNLGVQRDGFTEIAVSGLPADASFAFSVSGVQNVAYDGYFYEPQGGRSASQSLVGAFSGDTGLYAEAPFTAVVPDLFSLTIRKEDSLTLKGLAGAVFEISDTEDFSGLLYTVETDGDGLAVQGGLAAGIWYVREKTAPVGYIPYEGVFPVEVDQYTKVQRFKNTAYGGVEILKTDENGAPVAGATFSIYTGETADEAALYRSGLLTNDSGLILAGSIPPGVYTVVETAVPEGYHLNNTPTTVEVTPGARVTVTLINQTIRRGKLNLYKKDAETMRPLAGAKLGVYADPDFSVLIGEFVTKKTEPVPVENLLPGTYYIRELAVPEGYYQDAADQTVELREGETRDVIFYNNEIPHTAGNYGLLLLAGGGAALLVGVLLLAFRKRLFGSRS